MRIVDGLIRHVDGAQNSARDEQKAAAEDRIAQQADQRMPTKKMACAPPGYWVSPHAVFPWCLPADLATGLARLTSEQMHIRTLPDRFVPAGRAHRCKAGFTNRKINQKDFG
jgi:hypothetical protein